MECDREDEHSEQTATCCRRGQDGDLFCPYPATAPRGGGEMVSITLPERFQGGT